MSLNSDLNKRKWKIIEHKKLGDLNFLETLVYEWIRRSLYYPKFCLSNGILQAIGKQYRSILKMKPYEFEGDLDWVNNFRQKYNIYEVNRKMIKDIGYKIRKSIKHEEIYNDLKPQWEALHPEEVEAPSEIIEIKDEIKEECMDVEDVKNAQSSDSTVELDKIIEDICSDGPQNEGFDFEDELPVSTIFGRHISNLIVSKNKKSKIDHFRPMVVCTDPKNEQLNAMEEQEKSKNTQKSTEDKSIYPNSNKLDEVSISDKMDYKSLTSNQSKFLGKFLKDKIKDPKPTQIVYPTPAVPKQTSLVEEETATNPMPEYNIDKFRQLRPKPQIQNPPDSIVLSSSSLSDKSSKKKPIKKPRKTRSSVASTTIKKSSTETINQTPENFEISIEPPPLPINCRTVSTSKTSKKQPTCSPNLQMNVSTTNTQNITQPTLVSPTDYSLNTTNPDQNTNIIPSITPPATANIQPANTFVHPTALTQSVVASLPSNASFVQTEDSFLQPNSSLVQSTASFPQPNASFLQTENSFLQPNASFPQPNASFVQIEDSFLQPNTSLVQSSASYSQSIGSFVQTTAPGQPSILHPIIFHFHPSMPIQTTTNFLTPEILPTATSIVSEQNPINQMTHLLNSFPPQSQIISTTPTISPTTVQNFNSIRCNIPEGRGTKFGQRQPLKTQEEVVKCIKLMEEFAMLKENFRLIGFLERLEKHVNVVKK